MLENKSSWMWSFYFEKTPGAMGLIHIFIMHGEMCKMCYKIS